MDAQTIGIITLLRSAINGEALPLPAEFEIDKACPVLYEEQLVGMALQGAVRCGIPRSHPAVRRLMALFCKDVSRSKLQMQQLNRLYSLFESNGIDYMPIKGAVIKALYPQPEMRIMGDADILIRQEQYPRIRELLLEFGMQEDDVSDHRYTWHNDNLELEMHRRLIPSQNTDFYRYYGDGWKLAQKEGDGTVRRMRTEDHFVYLLVHFAKHYRVCDVSAKHICDFWVYRKAYPNMDETYIREQVAELHLTEFYLNILDVIAWWFTGTEPTPAAEVITDTVLYGSPYSVEESNALVSIIRRTNRTGSVKKSQRQFLLHRIFPNAGALSARFPVLKRCPVLLPVFWIVRWVSAIFSREQRQRGLEYSRGILDSNQEKVAEYERNLRQAGLGFNFPD